MSDDKPQTIFYGQRPDEERFKIIVEIGSSYPCPEHPGEWLCDMTVDPLFIRQRPVRAGDALQAFGMALSLALTTLDSFRDEGGRLTYENGDDVTLKAYTFGIAAGEGYSPNPA